ncbi:Excinuclease ABC, C subunit-like [hydrothermal vent metagenome]|uniref:Excinuclease ABC, C subunit-like n=1 Tax=hydrothermal vent metagenome TaxID=652676 RepID=A0A3B0SIF5_9ZZZZ
MAYYTYILASKRNGTLYVGMTNDLVRRIWEDKEELAPGFTKKYGVHRLVWFESHSMLEAAFSREKRLKHWLRAWKIELIEKENPNWDDLWFQINQP